MLSTEVDEHVELMDRVLVFREHEVFAELAREHVGRESLVSAFFGRADEAGMNIRRMLRTKTFLFAGLLAAALLIANVIQLPAFVSRDNWDANLIAFAPFAILAIASTPAVLTGQGGIDLSIAPLANLVNVVLVAYLLPSTTFGQRVDRDPDRARC